MTVNSPYRAPVRQTKAQLKLSVISPEAKENTVVILPNETAFSRGAEQLLNNVSDIGAKIATFEPGYWKLDGRAVLPREKALSQMEVGFWSALMSDENCLLTDFPTIEIRFGQAVDFPKLEIVFDEAGGVFCKDLEVWAYNSSAALVYNKRLVGTTAGAEAEGMRNVVTLFVRLYKTNEPFRFGRIAELNFGSTVCFDGEDILDVTLSCEGDPMGKRFPMSELNATIKNNGRFDQLDPASLAQYLQKRQPFEYKHGVVNSAAGGVIDWTYCGAYYLDTWRLDDDSVSFRAFGKVAALDRQTYEESSFEKKSIGSIITAVLKKAGIIAKVDAALNNSPPVAGYFGNAPYRSVLAYLAEGACALAYEDRNNAARFVDLCGELFVNGEITYEDMLRLPRAQLDAYYNGVNLAQYTPIYKDGQIAKVEYSLSGARDVKIAYSAPVLGDVTVTGENCAVTNIDMHAMYVTCRISGTGAASVTVSGKSVSFSREVIFYPAPWKDALERSYPLEVDLPYMIDDGALKPFRDWFLNRKFSLLNRRLSCECTWRQSPEAAIGETVGVQVSKGRAGIPMTICEDAMEYGGGVLKGVTKFFGGVV